MRDLNRFKGCLLGGAVGDALGYPIEFWEEREIFSKFGRSGITRYDLCGGAAEISDDTQMTLFTAVGLLFGQTRGMMRGIGGIHSDYIRRAYLDWLETQTHSAPVPGKRPQVAWVANFPEFYRQRAPGITCLSALRSGEYGTIEKPINGSKGCGGVMRAAPIGVYLCDRPKRMQEQVDLLGAQAAAITHGHELGYIPAAALVHIVSALASAEEPDVLSAVQDAVETMPKLFPNARYMDTFTKLMEKAIRLSGEDIADLDAIHELGKGWVAEETLAIAVYCALKYPNDFEKAVVAAVNHNGDSDSTGTVTGNILGAALGMDAIPEYYLETLELRDLIEEIAEDLYNDCQMEEYGDHRDPVWISKYIKIDYDREKRDEMRKGRT